LLLPLALTLSLQMKAIISALIKTNPRRFARMPREFRIRLYLAPTPELIAHLAERLAA
jgi:hypothetical protein